MSRPIPTEIEDLVDKYLLMLGVDDKPRPVVQVVNNLGSEWLGLTEWKPSRPDHVVIKLQQSILSDPLVLERVLAHEMIHHAEFISMEEGKPASVLRRLPPHGKKFREMAEVVNSEMGPDFVTEKSDIDFKEMSSGKEFFLLIVPIPSHNRLGWSWAARLTDEAKDAVRKEMVGGAKLIKTDFARWAIGKAKIKKRGGLNLPEVGSRDEQDLLDLFENNESLDVNEL